MLAAYCKAAYTSSLSCWTVFALACAMNPSSNIDPASATLNWAPHAHHSKAREPTITQRLLTSCSEKVFSRRHETNYQLIPLAAVTVVVLRPLFCFEPMQATAQRANQASPVRVPTTSAVVVRPHRAGRLQGEPKTAQVKRLRLPSLTTNYVPRLNATLWVSPEQVN